MRNPKNPYQEVQDKLAKEKSLLYFDIETRPMKVWAWSLGKTHISHEQISEESRVITIQWMFEGDKKVSWLTWDDNQDDAAMLRKFADAVKGAKVAVSQNGKSFDHKVLNWRMNVNNIPPLHTMTIFDTLTLSRAAFRPPSHKLDYRSKAYGLGGKIRMFLPDWIDVVERKPGSLEKMVKYGCKDILDLRTIFWRELPYYKSLPADIALLVYPVADKVAKHVCPMCAKNHQSKFNVIPIRRKNVTHLKCERCNHIWKE